MILCERCAAIVAEEERQERAFAAVIPPHLKLYDFGDGVTTMPIPDIEVAGSYLTTAIAFLQDLEGKRWCGMEIKYKKNPRSSSLIDSTDILEKIAETVPRFESEAAVNIDSASRKVRGMVAHG